MTATGTIDRAPLSAWLRSLAADFAAGRAALQTEFIHIKARKSLSR